MKEKSDQNTEGKNFTVRLEKNQFMSTVIFKSDNMYFLKPKSWQLQSENIWIAVRNIQLTTFKYRKQVRTIAEVQQVQI